MSPTLINAVLQGISLQYALQPRPMLAFVWAAVVAAVLAPLHRWR